MDSVFELIARLLAQLGIEFAVDSSRRRRRNRVRGRVARATSLAGQYPTAAIVAIVFGANWGRHLSESPRQSKVLWASLALALASGLLAMLRLGHGTSHGNDERWEWSWRTVLTPPWRWPSHRLIGIALVSVWTAISIVLGYKHTP